jgi:hypothetical protein
MLTEETPGLFPKIQKIAEVGGNTHTDFSIALDALEVDYNLPVSWEGKMYDRNAYTDYLSLAEFLELLTNPITILPQKGETA